MQHRAGNSPASRGFIGSRTRSGQHAARQPRAVGYQLGTIMRFGEIPSNAQQVGGVRPIRGLARELWIAKSRNRHSTSRGQLLSGGSAIPEDRVTLRRIGKLEGLT